jgi:hypothetical protein
MPLVSAHGTELRADARPFRAFGFNYIGGPDRMGTLEFFHRPTPERLREIASHMRVAKDLGANTLRIYLELFAFINRVDGEVRVRRRALRALEQVLARAERLRLYLDVTGNLVWTPGGSPPWYDAMSARQRWRIQVEFWRAVAGVAARSPAVLCYELCSEPWISAEPQSAWYVANLGGYNFGQLLVRDAAGCNPELLARGWIRSMSRAIRGHDRRHLIGIGLLPFRPGSFSPANVAERLDVLLVHAYPTNESVDGWVAIIRDFASHGRPLILGETFTLRDDEAAQRRFLLGARPHLAGYLSFFDGRTPDEVAGETPADVVYRAGLQQFVDLRPRLLRVNASRPPEAPRG